MEKAFQRNLGLGDREAELPDSVEGRVQQQASLVDKEAELPDTPVRASMEIECSKPDNQKQGIVVMDLTTEVEEEKAIAEIEAEVEESQVDSLDSVEKDNDNQQAATATAQAGGGEQRRDKNGNAMERLPGLLQAAGGNKCLLTVTEAGTACSGRATNKEGEIIQAELVEMQPLETYGGHRMIFAVWVGTDLVRAAELNEFTSKGVVVDKSEVSNWADAYKYLWKELGEKWQRYQSREEAEKAEAAQMGVEAEQAAEHAEAENAETEQAEEEEAE